MLGLIVAAREKALSGFVSPYHIGPMCDVFGSGNALHQLDISTLCLAFVALGFGGCRLNLGHSLIARLRVVTGYSGHSTELFGAFAVYLSNIELIFILNRILASSILI